MGSADHLLAIFTDRRPPDPALALLRLGAVEMLALGEAAHGVVDAAVELAKRDRATVRLAGLVNAVLRRVAREGPELWEGFEHGRLNAAGWLTRALRADWGRKTATAIAEAHLRPAPVDLTPRDGDAAALAARLGGAALPTGSVRLDRPGMISHLPGFAEGEWWAQDAAAAVPARLAGPGKGRRALDLCAAPGGKTMQLAAAGWRVTALDASAARMGRLSENLERTGLAAETVVADALDWRAEPFDLVLLDAPCSATGTIRRHPELPRLRDDSGLSALTELQGKMLDAAWALTAPGGTLIYATCSLLKAEGEERAAAFAEAHAEAVARPVTAEEAGDAALVSEAGAFRARPDFWPERGGLDGFFAARFSRA